MQQFILALFVLGNIFVGFAVYYNNPKSWTNRLFTVLIGLLITYLTINTELFLFDDHTTKLFLSRTIIALGALINLFMFLFLITFPRDKITLKKKSLYPLILVTIGLFIAGFTNLIFSGVTVENNVVVPNPGLLMPVFLLHTVGLVFGGILAIFLRYRKSHGLEKNKIKYVLFGFFMLFSLIIVLNFIVTVFLKFGNFVPFLPLYILIFNIIIAYAIIRHRLLDIRVLVSRTASYSLLIILIIAAYTTTLSIASQQLPQTYRTPVTVAVVLLFTLSFGTIRRIVEEFTENIFHHRSYKPEELLEATGKIVRSTLSLTTITKNVTKRLKTTMHIDSLAFIITSKNKLYHVHSVGFDEEPTISISNIQFLSKKAKTGLLVFEDLKSGKVKQIMKDMKVSVIIPLTVKSDSHGLIVVGEKSSGDIYNNKDLEVFELFAPQISLSIKNAIAYDQIRRFNITLKKEIAAATDDLREANRHLRHLDKLKDEFVFIATHELKNPVTAMRGYLSMIQEGTLGPVPKQLKEPIDQLQASNQQLVTLVNDLLQIARSEAKTLKVEVEPVDLCPLIDEIIKNVQPVADQKKIKLSHQCAKSTLKVKADPNRLKEIINNLISNAIKYSDEGAVSITHATETGHIITHVADQGRGIPKKAQQKIFTRFFRAEDEVVKGTPGTGLGLFIVRQLVEKMNGKIWFSSTEGKGTTFSFSLPKA